MFKRKKQDPYATAPSDEETAILQAVLVMANRLGTVGEIMTPELVEVAADGAGAEAAVKWMRNGASAEAIRQGREAYRFVGVKAARLFGPGGEFEGAVVADPESE
ncbi:hypothetical protein FE634_15465 [Nocardioides dongxiaopingii]|uniref:hypothetical protein n=1 Tax=Nocardioides sp. S-1144 TaxID=2582905 RepID=UPI00110E3615|nr:hypothetical protein [Nocardioides sp. S-1144]QCW51457.1 hypothetical protein FE634_15465 [Nocardioides sp. S-1144]